MGWAERELQEERRKRTWEALAAQEQLAQAVADRDRLQILSDTACTTLNQVAHDAVLRTVAYGAVLGRSAMSTWLWDRTSWWTRGRGLVQQWVLEGNGGVKGSERG